MQSISPFSQKFMGAFTLFILVSFTFLFSSPFAYGAFESNNEKLIFDGIIDSGKDQAANAGYYSVLTTSTKPISVLVSNETKFINGKPDWGNLVRVSAYELDGDYYAKDIRITKKNINHVEGNYSVGGKVIIKKGIVISKYDQKLMIQFGSEYYIAFIHVTDATDYTGKAKSYSQVNAGDIVTIQGTDKKYQGFVATKVSVTKSTPIPTVIPPTIEKSVSQPTNLASGIGQELLKFDVVLNGITPNKAFLGNVKVNITSSGNGQVGVGKTATLNDGLIYLYNGSNELIACAKAMNGGDVSTVLEIGNNQDCQELTFSTDTYSVGSTSGDPINSARETYTVRADVYSAGADNYLRTSVDLRTTLNNLIWTSEGNQVAWLPLGSSILLHENTISN